MAVAGGIGIRRRHLVFRNQMFIQWKPTIFNWVLALVFKGASQYIGDKNLMERTLGSQIHLPKPVWSKLNLLWVTNFAIVGASTWWWPTATARTPG